MLSILRIVTGLIFFSAATMKLFGFPPMPPGAPPVLPMSQMWIGGVLEVIGGAAINARVLHPSGGVGAGRRDGRRVLPVSSAAVAVPVQQQRHARDSLLLHLSVLRVRGRRCVEVDAALARRTSPLRMSPV
ncbi:MAG TPA: hypothetical protein VFM14_12760 [Gemmatimonadales bacterium]|nr:hypothetical protein [Gemmatimonadales bacterium]